MLGAREVIQAALQEPGQMVWVVGQVDKGVRRVYRKVLSQLPKVLLEADPPSEASNDRILRFKNGSRIEFYTAGTPSALAGEGVDFVLIDEAALIAPTVWTQLIRPTLSDTKGRALLISTPRGRDWFHTAWQRGQDPTKPLYESWQFPSVSSPYVDAEEVADAEDTLPAVIFAQEYLAEFVQNAASIFSLEGEGYNAVRPGLDDPEGWVNIGIDLAKKEDFTVISGSNAATRRPCVFERFNEVSWPVQEAFIKDVLDELDRDPEVEGVSVAIDSTGVGDVVFDHLEDLGVDVVPINFGAGQIKERMARLLAADLEHGRAFITEEMRPEFEAFAYEITSNGRYKFEAPEGMHDDMVAAKMLENWMAVHEAPPGVQVYDPEQDHSPEVEELLPEDEEGAVEELVRDDPRSMMNRPEVWA